MQYIHTMEYYLALRRNEILLPAATWMNLENIMPSKISQLQKHKYDSTYEVPRIGKFVETETIIEVPMGWGKEAMGNQCFMGTGLSFGDNGQVWKWRAVMVVQHCEWA